MTGTPDPDDELMIIGQFSSLARISVRMLRHYDEHGVLAPVCIDDANGYRRYSSAQLERAVRIRQLRDVGFGVPAIATLLTTQGTPTHAQALAMQREVLVRDLRVARQRIALIDQLVATEEKPRMNVTITQKTYPAQTVVALRDVIPAYDKEGELWDRFTPELPSPGVRAVILAALRSLHARRSQVSTTLRCTPPIRSSSARDAELSRIAPQRRDGLGSSLRCGPAHLD